MDPLTALGLAASVTQFVSFASHLINKTKEIHASASGQTNEAATLETTYSSLQALSSRLEKASRRDARLEVVQGNTDFVKHVFAINDLSRACEGDCKRLLDVIGKLKTGTGTHSGRRFQSFRVALKTIWKGDEIKELEQRLHYTGTILTLQVCSLTSFWHGSFGRSLRQLRRESLELNAQQSSKLGEMSRTLDELAARMTSARSVEMPNTFNTDDIQSIEGQMARLSLSKASAAKENMIIRSLSFDSRLTRHSSILEASLRTFEWAFEEARRIDPDNSGHASTATATGDLLKWLRKDHGFFWVTGKPGSGKSTFMKFVADHPTTLAALSRWSHPKRTVLASHYFWSAGTPMQKSQQGLLQTLLYDIFRQLPDLIETVCLERGCKTIEEMAREPWQVAELQRVLKRIAELQQVPVKFCFFIDGLDEFSGDHVDFCRSLHELAQSPHVKLCVSSRAWNVFEDSFGKDNMDSKLYIHELTRNDVRTYAERRLQEHPRWKELDTEVSNASWLIEEITNRAAGVFLWVFLVTNELRSGLSEYDSFSDLQRRLESIPGDLEAFFKRMLDSVDSFYHHKMATTLQMSLAATEPAPVAVYNFHDAEYEDKDYALKLPLQALDESTCTSLCDKMTRRLRGCCRGLLDVNRHGNRVEFLHRSVMDFLRTREMSEFLARNAPPSFDASLSLIRAYTAYIKTTRFPEHVDRTTFNQHTASGLMSAVHETLAQARELRGEMAEAAYQLLDELDRCIPLMHSSGQAQLNVWGNRENPVTLFFREPVVDTGLVQYLARTLPLQPDYFVSFEWPVLSCVIDSLKWHLATPPSTVELRTKLNMIRCLLENGCNPNEAYYDPLYCYERTPWDDFVACAKSYENSQIQSTDPEKSFKEGVLEDLRSLMLQYGTKQLLWPSGFATNGFPPNATAQKRSLSQAGFDSTVQASSKRIQDYRKERERNTQSVLAHSLRCNSLGPVHV